jgi:hypothetical protein
MFSSQAQYGDNFSSVAACIVMEAVFLFRGAQPGRRTGEAVW